MIRVLVPAALVALAAPAAAADRVVGIASFDRLRLEGALAVTIATGRSPRATISGDRAVIADIDVHTDGGTVTIRRAASGQWGEQATAVSRLPVTITLTTPVLTGVTVLGGGKVSVDRVAGARADLSVTGAGAIVVAAAATDLLNAQVIGNGAIMIAGKAATVRLSTNGAGTIDAAKLVANDLTIRLDGAGATTAYARYTARIGSNGLGTVTVGGRPKCTVQASSTAPVTCGDPAASRR